MPIYTVGAGKTYDSADGILLALNDVPNDFTAETEDHVIEVYPGYSYFHAMTVKKTITNTSPTKKLIIRPASGYEHNGDFTQGIECRTNSSRWLWIACSYFEFTNFRFVHANTVRGYSLHLNGNCNYNKIENLLFDLHTGEGVTTDHIYCIWADGGSFDYSRINNCIAYNDGLTTAGYYPLITTAGTSAIGTKVNNSLGYKTNPTYDFYQPVEVNNSGSIDGSYGVLTGVTGSQNYGNSPSGPGTDYVNNTKAFFQFLDIDNKKFTLKITSPLIGSGSNVSASNPYDIRGNLWQGNHKSPYNHIIITNAYLQPPEDTEYIRGNWMNEMVYNCLQPAGKILIGNLENENAYSTHLPSYDYCGYITKCAFTINYNTILKPINGKFLTISCLHKRSSTSGANSIPFGSVNTWMTVDTSIADMLRFTIGSYYGESTSLSSYVDKNDYFNVICQINLEATTDAERIIFYLYQKGTLHKVPLTFSGTAPSAFSEPSNGWIVGYHTDYQGVTSAWNRLLSFEEIYTIAYDPYVVYRSDKKLFRMTGVIQEGLLMAPSGLQFSGQFIGQLIGNR